MTIPEIRKLPASHMRIYREVFLRYHGDLKLHSQMAHFAAGFHTSPGERVQGEIEFDFAPWLISPERFDEIRKIRDEREIDQFVLESEAVRDR